MSINLSNFHFDGINLNGGSILKLAGLFEAIEDEKLGIFKPVKKNNAFKSLWRRLNTQKLIVSFRLYINDYIGCFGSSNFLMNKVFHLILCDFKGNSEEMLLFRAASLESCCLGTVTFQYTNDVICSMKNLAIISTDLAKRGIKVEGERNKNTNPYDGGTVFTGDFIFGLNTDAIIVFVKLLMNSDYRDKQWSNQLCSKPTFGNEPPIFHQLRTSLYLSTYSRNLSLSTSQTEALYRLEKKVEDELGFLRKILPREAIFRRSRSAYGTCHSGETYDS